VSATKLKLKGETKATLAKVEALHADEKLKLRAEVERCYSAMFDEYTSNARAQGHAQGMAAAEMAFEEKYAALLKAASEHTSRMTGVVTIKDEKVRNVAKPLVEATAAPSDGRPAEVLATGREEATRRSRCTTAAQRSMAMRTRTGHWRTVSQPSVERRRRRCRAQRPAWRCTWRLTPRAAIRVSGLRAVNSWRGA
jgi:hypothetical protein